MKKFTCSLRVALLVLSLMLVFAVSVQAETVNCTPITTVPFTIDTEGIYCLTGNLYINNGTAITIDASDVVLDLNGFKIEDQAGPDSQGVGIYAYGQVNITVKNGTVRGFEYAINIDGDRTVFGGHVVENMRTASARRGIWVYGIASIIRNNQVTSSASTAGVSFYGILAQGAFSKVVNNDVVLTTDSGGRGIYFGNSSQNVVENNRITNLSLNAPNTYGIKVDGSTDVLVTNNRITNTTYGIYGAVKYRDNLTSGVTTPYYGGTDAGNNN